MDLREFLGRLRNVKGPTGKGEYICRCPAHDDQHSSLWVTEGRKGIILKCQAGCSKEAVLRAMGLGVYDLLNDETRAEWDKHAANRGADPRKKRDAPAPARKPPAEKKQGDKADLKVHTPKTYDSYDAAYGWIGKLVCCYRYTDENGKLLFEVARIQTADGKTFRQHRPAEPGKGLFPIICNVPAEVRGSALYRLPEVMQAVREGKMVYVVEGEKDADTLAKLGRCATTSPMGADHWQSGHSAHLKGADVVVIPDADASGGKYSDTIVANTAGVARSLRVVQLRDAYPDLPDKGDITDLVELVGAQKAMEMLDALVAAAEPVEPDLHQQAIEIYRNMFGYCIVNGCIAKWGENSSRPLGTFVALPVGEITKDDGAQLSKFLEIVGWDSSGTPLPRQLVSMARFKSMDWAMEGWGLAANILPGNTVRDQLRSAIATAGAMVAKRRTIYTHTGWRKIGGKWVYLHEDGCIGMDGVSVEMEAGMTAYTLGDVPKELSAQDAAITSFSLTSVLSEHVAVPMLALVYLAPLREFLMQAGSPPVFILMLRGATGMRKSTAAALALSHFGHFESTTPPSSFMDTANSVRRKAFVVKDMPLLIDDYHPTTSLQERRKMETVMQALTRTFGNLASRGRMNSDLTIQVAMPARCMAMVTGEETPNVGDSGISRFYEVEFEPDDVPANAQLTELQQRARAGELRAAMRGYIEWLIPQADALPKRLGRMFVDYRMRAAQMMEGLKAHGRSVEACAHLMIGLTLMLEYFRDQGLCDDDVMNYTLESYWKLIVGISARQVRANGEESAVQMFMTAVSEMLASGTLSVVDISPGTMAKKPDKGMCGYVDMQNYYFMGETVYGAVVHFYRDQDRVFPVGRAALYKRLKDQGIVQQAGNDGKTTRVKRTPDGKNQRLLWIPRWKLDGGREPDIQGTQERMEFKDVPDDEIPEELR